MPSAQSYPRRSITRSLSIARFSDRPRLLRRSAASTAFAGILKLFVHRRAGECESSTQRRRDAETQRRFPASASVVRAAANATGRNSANRKTLVSCRSCIRAISSCCPPEARRRCALLNSCALVQDFRSQRIQRGKSELCKRAENASLSAPLRLRVDISVLLISYAPVKNQASVDAKRAAPTRGVPITRSLSIARFSDRPRLLR
jgi:hypothetical protein